MFPADMGRNHQRSSGSDGSDEPQVISTRVCLLSGRLIGAFPDLKLDQEIELLQKLQQILQTISEFISKVAGKTSIDENILEFFDPPVRLLVTLLTKTGALTRLARRSEVGDFLGFTMVYRKWGYLWGYHWCPIGWEIPLVYHIKRYLLDTHWIPIGYPLDTYWLLNLYSLDAQLFFSGDLRAQPFAKSAELLVLRGAAPVPAAEGAAASAALGQRGGGRLSVAAARKFGAALWTAQRYASGKWRCSSLEGRCRSVEDPCFEINKMLKYEVALFKSSVIDCLYYPIILISVVMRSWSKWRSIRGGFPNNSLRDDRYNALATPRINNPFSLINEVKKHHGLSIISRSIFPIFSGCSPFLHPKSLGRPWIWAT